MNQNPTMPRPPAIAKIGDESPSARFAVAIFTFPETVTVLLWQTIGKALNLGLARHGVEIVLCDSHYLPFFTVACFTIKKSAHAAALAAIKTTLQELDLWDRATVANYVADEYWVTSHGWGSGGIEFERAFMKLEDIKACAEDLTKFISTSALRIQAFKDFAKRNSPPGSSATTDSK